MTKVVANGGFTALADGDSKTAELMCTAAGEYAFERAVNNALRQGSRGHDQKAELDSQAAHDKAGRQQGQENR